MDNSLQEMPLFTKTFDLLTWLVPKTESFPKLYRATVTQRLLDALLDFQERILTANALRSRARLERLLKADGDLDKVRLYLRLAHRLEWLSTGQYEHVSRMVAEVGRLLGRWIAVTRG